ncbi:unnamed protein product, partial [marine sediment metagenome]
VAGYDKGTAQILLLKRLREVEARLFEYISDY